MRINARHTDLLFGATMSLAMSVCLTAVESLARVDLELVRWPAAFISRFPFAFLVALPTALVIQRPVRKLVGTMVGRGDGCAGITTERRPSIVRRSRTDDFGNEDRRNDT